MTLGLGIKPEPALVEGERSHHCTIPALKRICSPNILVPRGCAPFGQRQESQPLAQSNDILVLNGFVNTTD